MYFCVVTLYVFDIVNLKAQNLSAVSQLIVLASLTISVAIAWFNKKWKGQILLFINLCLIGAAPFILGVISKWFQNSIVINISKTICVGIPLLFIVFPLISFSQGNMNEWEPTIGFVISGIIKSAFWLTMFVYLNSTLKAINK